MADASSPIMLKLMFGKLPILLPSYRSRTENWLSESPAKKKKGEGSGHPHQSPTSHQITRRSDGTGLALLGGEPDPEIRRPPRRSRRPSPPAPALRLIGVDPSTDLFYRG
jgi:hypothetical protein